MTIWSVLTQAFTKPSFVPEKELPDLTGKVALVTGASTGLGKVTAQELARKGAHVFCVGRTPEKTKAAIEDIKKITGNEHVEFIQADLMDLKSVEAAADTFLSKNLPLHILVNNAGIMAVPFELSKDQIESQFATNHFAHVVLTNKLLPLIIKSQPARIVNVSSFAHTFAPKEGVLMDELNDETKYDPWQRYGETKISNIYFTQVLQSKVEKLGGDRVYVNAVHPGIVTTELTRNIAKPRSEVNGKIIQFATIGPFNGALTQIYVAAHKDIEEKGFRGRYFVPYCSLASPSAIGKDIGVAQKVWDWTETVLKEKFRKNWSWSEAGL